MAHMDILRDGRGRVRIDMEGLTKEDIAWHNFKGAPDNLNPEGGHRSVTIKLDDDQAEALKEFGFNIKRDERYFDNPTNTLKIVIYIPDDEHPYGAEVSRYVNGEGEYLNADTLGLLDLDINNNGLIEACCQFYPKLTKNSGKVSARLMNMSANCAPSRDYGAKFGSIRRNTPAPRPSIDEDDDSLPF